MLNQPTIEKLQAMKLHGMAEAFQEQIEIPESSQLSFEERLGLLVDRQWTWKEARALTRRLQLARFKERGVVEDINYQHPRGLTARLERGDGLLDREEHTCAPQVLGERGVLH